MGSIAESGEKADLGQSSAYTSTERHINPLWFSASSMLAYRYLPGIEDIIESIPTVSQSAEDTINYLCNTFDVSFKQIQLQALRLPFHPICDMQD